MLCSVADRTRGSRGSASAGAVILLTARVNTVACVFKCDRRHGQHNGGHGPSAIDVQTVADADGRGDEDAEQPGSAQAGAVGFVRRDQARVREAGRGRAQGTVGGGGRRPLGRRPFVRGVVVARARRRRRHRLRATVAELRFVRHGGHHRRHLIVPVGRPRRPGCLPGGTVVQAPAVPPAPVVRRKSTGCRGVRALCLSRGTVENEQIVVRR